ncbi:MAG: PIN domain nuclease [Acidobacteria bacterium]|nr:PIN domain nuclease [Acidobacteriota bacterium]
MNREKVLVDTSAWILSFRKTGHTELKDFVKSAILAESAATCPVIILELLQGCRDKDERDTLRSRLESLEVLPVSPAVWDRAYELGFSVRRKGLSVPTTDLLVASVAIESSCLIVHCDKHYEMIQNHSTLRARWMGRK